jgi:hypothetical protein
MAKVPRELQKQIEMVDNVMGTLNLLIESDKVSTKYYGKDFIEPLSDIRKQALELRGQLEVFKNNMDYAIKAQYDEVSNNRFASTAGVSSDMASKVIGKHLAKPVE